MKCLFFIFAFADCQQTPCRYRARQYALLVYSIISPLQVRLPGHPLVLQDPERDRDDLSSAGVQREVRRTEDLVHGVRGETGGARARCRAKVLDIMLLLQEHEAAEVVQYIEHLLPLLEHSEFIERYAWFLSRYYEVLQKREKSVFVNILQSIMIFSRNMMTAAIFGLTL